MADIDDNSPNAKSSTTEDLEREKLEIELQLKRKELEAFGKTPVAPTAPPKPWWTVAVELIGLPAAILGLVVAFTTASGNISTNRKTGLETEQIRAELAKAAEGKAAETNKLATDLSSKEKEGPKAFEQAVAHNADKIQSALERLQQLEEQSAHLNVQKAVLKFVMLWILFSVTGLVFDVIRLAWSTSSSTLMYGLNAWLARGDDAEDESHRRRARRRRDLFNRLAPGFFLILNPLPDVLRWSIQLSIFAVLLGPLFNEIAISFGSKITFGDVLGEAKHLHFGAMLSLMRQILFGQ